MGWVLGLQDVDGHGDFQRCNTPSFAVVNKEFWHALFRQVGSRLKSFNVSPCIPINR